MVHVEHRGSNHVRLERVFVVVCRCPYRADCVPTGRAAIETGHRWQELGTFHGAVDLLIGQFARVGVVPTDDVAFEDVHVVGATKREKIATLGVYGVGKLGDEIVFNRDGIKGVFTLQRTVLYAGASREAETSAGGVGAGLTPDWLLFFAIFALANTCVGSVTELVILILAYWTINLYVGEVIMWELRLRLKTF